jgi:hypothetical protein
MLLFCHYLYRCPAWKDRRKSPRGRILQLAGGATADKITCARVTRLPGTPLSNSLVAVSWATGMTALAIDRESALKR